MKGYLDIVALVVSFLVGAVFMISLNRKNNKRLRPVSLYFFLLGPALIMVHMAFHLGQNLYRAGEETIRGTFHYGFHFYSLIFLGVALFLCGYVMHNKLTLYCQGRADSKSIWKIIMVIALISVPLIPITPFSFLPLLASVFSLAAMPWVFKESTSTVV